MEVTFTAHNIRLDDGTFTKPDIGYSIDQHAWCVTAKRVLDLVFPGPADRSRLKLIDLGCLEGGYSVEFARMGFQVLGIDVRAANIAACNYVRSRVALPNLEFAEDDVWNIARHGPFDAVFCCGLLYHLDRPKKFLDLLGQLTRKLVIIQTHFAAEKPNPNYALSPQIVENEGMRGRWFAEFPNEGDFTNRENLRWSSWDNQKSFWMTRDSLFQSMHDAGFPIVMEEFGGFGPDIAANMRTGIYAQHDRGTFIGIKV